MKQETKILIVLGVGAAVVSGLALAGYKYKQAAEALQFGVGGISPLGVDDNGLRVLINVKIKNASSFVFPVPQAFVKFNVAGKEVGAAQTTQWQTIGANAETVLPLVGYFRINELGDLITLLYNATTLPKDILYSGYVDFGKFQIPFNSSYAIGKTFKKKPTTVFKCRDGYYSDSNSPGACTWHGGLVDKEKPISLCIIPKNKGKKTSDSKLAINDIPVSDVKIYLEKFQNRKNPYSEESVNRIIEAVENGTFRFEEFDPVLIWNSPDGNKYMLSGHSRLEAFTRLCNAGKLKFCNIPAKLIDVTAQEAEEIAMRSNTLSTKEKDTERALFYMKQIALGKPYREVIETAKKTEGSNAARIVAYAYLNPIGKTFVALQSLEAGDPTSQTIIRAIGQWIGEARQKFPMLTNLHEDELYNWLIGGGFGKQYKNKADFLAKLAAIISQRTYFGEFDSNKPLNVTNQVTKSFSEKQFDAQVEELKDKVKEMEAQIKTKTLDYKSRGASEDQIYNLLQNDYGYLNRVRNQLLNLMQKKAEVIDSSKNELALFGLQSHSISGISQKRFSVFL